MIRTYVDSGVLIAAWRSSDLIQRLKARQILLDLQARELVFSDFVKLEVSPKAERHRNLAELHFYSEILSSGFMYISQNDLEFDDVYALACKYGLGAVDAYHALAAISAGAQEFITTEKPGKAFFGMSEFSAISLSDL